MFEFPKLSEETGNAFASSLSEEEWADWWEASFLAVGQRDERFLTAIVLSMVSMRVPMEQSRFVELGAFLAYELLRAQAEADQLNLAFGDAEDRDGKPSQGNCDVIA